MQSDHPEPKPSCSRKRASIVPIPSSTSCGSSNSETEEIGEESSSSSGQSSGLSSDPFSDYKAGDPDPISPKRDPYLYAEQVIHMAMSLDFQITSSVLKPQVKILERLYSSTPSAIVFLVLEEELDIISTIWEKPPSISITLRRVENSTKFSKKGAHLLILSLHL